MCSGGVNGGLHVSCMLKMAEKKSLSALESGLKFPVLCVRNQDTRDGIRNLLVIGHLVVDVELVKALAAQPLQLSPTLHRPSFTHVARVLADLKLLLLAIQHSTSHSE